MHVNLRLPSGPALRTDGFECEITAGPPISIRLDHEDQPQFWMELVLTPEELLSLRGMHDDAEEFCDECGAQIPDDAESIIGPYHAASCSCHSDNVRGK